MNSCREWSYCSNPRTSLCIMEEVTMCRRNSSIEAVHSQHTVDTSINSVWEECTSKLFQICSYSLAGSHLHLHWAFPGTTSAQLSPVLLYQIFNRKRTGFTARWDQTHLYCVWQLESHFLPFNGLTLTLGTVSLKDRAQCQESTLIQDDDIKMNSRPSFPLQLPIHCLWHTSGNTGTCSKQILNLTKNKWMMTRWLLESMQSETQDRGSKLKYC